MTQEHQYVLPRPTRVFHAIGDAEIEMDVHPHDELTFNVRRVPGGRFSAELGLHFEYAGYEGHQVINLDREGAEELRDALDEVLE